VCEDRKIAAAPRSAVALRLPLAWLRGNGCGEEATFAKVVWRDYLTAIERAAKVGDARHAESTSNRVAAMERGIKRLSFWRRRSFDLNVGGSERSAGRGSTIVGRSAMHGDRRKTIVATPPELLKKL